ncbi:MAG TPA: hypothetical protein ENI86_01960 [Acidimicrobiales bacterium]|nr:hypothetical protein [Acidimicrobiales bacterium]
MSDTSKRVVAGIVAVVVTIGALYLVAAGPASDRATTQLGDEVFGDLEAASVAADVASDGPLFFADLTGGSRDIWVTHSGVADNTGFDALSALDPAGCPVDWDRERGEFVSTCDGTGYGPDGTGLTHYPVTVSDGKLVIDLNFDQRGD